MKLLLTLSVLYTLLPVVANANNLDLQYRITRNIIITRGVDPERALRFAKAITKTKHPLIIAAIGKAEGTFNPNEPVGPAGERGAFRVIPKHHGKVPRSIEGQVEQVYKNLQELLEANKVIPLAVERFNGAGKAARKYSKYVLQASLSF